ncbi:hypothetical protein HaLaN_29097, partial [Haematococcus lacustris]
SALKLTHPAVRLSAQHCGLVQELVQGLVQEHCGRRRHRAIVKSSCVPREEKKGCSGGYKCQLHLSRVASFARASLRAETLGQLRSVERLLQEHAACLEASSLASCASSTVDCTASQQGSNMNISTAT